MSVEVMRRVWAVSESTGSARLVLLAIADCCNSDDGTGAWPSIPELCAKTRLGDRTVQRAIRALQKLGELWVERNAGPNGVNRYRVVLSRIPVNLTPRQSDTPVNLTGSGDEASPQVKGQDPVNLTPPRQFDAPVNLTPGTISTNNKQTTRARDADIDERTPFPTGFTVTDEMREWAARKRPGVDVDAETEQWELWNRARGTRLASWDDAWRGWILKCRVHQGSTGSGAQNRSQGDSGRSAMTATERAQAQVDAALAEAIRKYGHYQQEHDPTGLGGQSWI